MFTSRCTKYAAVGKQCIFNGILATPPRHPIFRELIDRMITTVRKLGT